MTIKIIFWNSEIFCTRNNTLIVNCSIYYSFFITSSLKKSKCTRMIITIDDGSILEFRSEESNKYFATEFPIVWLSKICSTFGFADRKKYIFRCLFSSSSAPMEIWHSKRQQKKNSKNISRWQEVSFQDRQPLVSSSLAIYYFLFESPWFINWSNISQSVISFVANKY